MCQRLYIASRNRLQTKRKKRSAFLLSVDDVSTDPSARGRFGSDREFVYLVGGHAPCGCGFPAIPAEAGPPGLDVDPLDLQSMRALAEHLRDACRGHSTVELYLCWAHDESEPPLTQRTVVWPDLVEDHFRLRHREMLTVGRAP